LVLLCVFIYGYVLGIAYTEEVSPKSHRLLYVSLVLATLSYLLERP